VYTFSLNKKWKEKSHVKWVSNNYLLIGKRFGTISYKLTNGVCGKFRGILISENGENKDARSQNSFQT